MTQLDLTQFEGCTPEGWCRIPSADFPGLFEVIRLGSVEFKWQYSAAQSMTDTRNNRQERVDVDLAIAAPTLLRELHEARAENVRLKEELDEAQGRLAEAQDGWNDALHQRDEAKAEIERLEGEVSDLHGLLSEWRTAFVHVLSDHHSAPVSVQMAHFGKLSEKTEAVMEGIDDRPNENDLEAENRQLLKQIDDLEAELTRFKNWTRPFEDW